jgi:hypothetical protein
VSAVDGLGTLPQADLGVEVAAIGGWGPARLELAYSAWQTSTSPIRSGSLGVTGLAVDFATATARAGAELPGTPLGIHATYEVGAMEGRGIGMFTGGSTDRWSAIGGGVTARAQMVQGVWMVFSWDMVVALDRPVYTMMDGTYVWQPEPTSMRLAAGLQIGWP